MNSVVNVPSFVAAASCVDEELKGHIMYKKKHNMSPQYLHEAYVVLNNIIARDYTVGRTDQIFQDDSFDRLGRIMRKLTFVKFPF